MTTDSCEKCGGDGILTGDEACPLCKGSGHFKRSRASQQMQQGTFSLMQMGDSHEDGGKYDMSRRNNICTD